MASRIVPQLRIERSPPALQTSALPFELPGRTWGGWRPPLPSSLLSFQGTRSVPAACGSPGTRTPFAPLKRRDFTSSKFVIRLLTDIQLCCSYNSPGAGDRTRTCSTRFKRPGPVQSGATSSHVCCQACERLSFCRRGGTRTHEGPEAASFTATPLCRSDAPTEKWAL